MQLFVLGLLIAIFAHGNGFIEDKIWERHHYRSRRQNKNHVTMTENNVELKDSNKVEIIMEQGKGMGCLRCKRHDPDEGNRNNGWSHHNHFNHSRQWHEREGGSHHHPFNHSRQWHEREGGNNNTTTHSGWRHHHLTHNCEWHQSNGTHSSQCMSTTGGTTPTSTTTPTPTPSATSIPTTTTSTFCDIFKDNLLTPRLLRGVGCDQLISTNESTTMTLDDPRMPR